VVWKLSWLAQSLTQVIKTTVDIDRRGIALKVLTQNIDTTTPEGRLFFHMMAALNEFQRKLIVENTRAGLAAANKRRRWGGRLKGMSAYLVIRRPVPEVAKRVPNQCSRSRMAEQLPGRYRRSNRFPPRYRHRVGRPLLSA